MSRAHPSVRKFLDLEADVDEEDEEDEEDDQDMQETIIDESTEDVSSPQIHDKYRSDSDRTAATFMQAHPSVRKFLDLEADVEGEDDEDEDDDQDMQETFIDDSTEDVSSPQNNYRSESERTADSEHIGSYYEDLLTRVYSSVHRAGGNLPRHSSNNTESIIRHRGADDMPMWRVKCRIGVEEILVAHLYAHAQDQHGLRSALALGSTRGYIYLECNLNTSLLRLLDKSPGVIRTQNGIIRSQIDSLDCEKLLRMKAVKPIAKVGWIRVTTGTYKGDVGFVSATHNWGVDVLLIPRLAYHSAPDTKGKRKASKQSHPPRLFDVDEFESTSSSTVIRSSDGTYTIGTLRIEHGLALKTFDYHSVASEIFHMPWVNASMYLSSGHPSIDISTMPRPQEWYFAEKEHITVRGSGKSGFLEAITPTSIEVSLGNEGVHRVSWWDVKKVFALGDYVSIAGGQNKGRDGWIIELIDNTAKVAEKLKIGALNSFDTLVIEAHVNCLKLAGPPPQSFEPLAVQKEQIKPTPRHRWCGTTVIVTKQGHALKGNMFRVENVLFNQATVSGMRLELTNQQYSPYTPFQKRITVDYHDVIEQSSFLDLETYFKDHIAHIHPTATLHTTSPSIASTQSSQAAITQMPGSLQLTPTWNPSAETESPMNVLSAWDPSSRTPVPHAVVAEADNTDLYPLSVLNSSQNSSTNHPTQINVNDRLEMPASRHVLLNKSLAKVKLNVIVNGGGCIQKEVAASVMDVDGHLEICHIKYGKTNKLQPEWVTPKHPNAAHDNGLLIVINGEHCGKFVRRLHHRHTDSVSLMTLAVITRGEDGSQTLEDEVLELGTNILCTVTEPKEERDKYKGLTQALRNEYRMKGRV